MAAAIGVGLEDKIVTALLSGEVWTLVDNPYLRLGYVIFVH